MLQTQLSPPNSLSDFPCFIFNFVCTAARATFQCQSPDSTLPLYYAALSPSSASALCNRRVEFSVSFPGVFPEFSSLPASSLRHLLIVRCYFRSTWNPLNWFLNSARNSLPPFSRPSISGMPALHPLVINIYSLAK